MPALPNLPRAPGLAAELRADGVGGSVPAGHPVGGAMKPNSRVLKPVASGSGFPEPRWGEAVTRSKSIPGKGQLRTGAGAFLALISQLSPSGLASSTSSPCERRSFPGSASIPRTSDEGCRPRSQIHFITIIEKLTSFSTSSPILLTANQATADIQAVPDSKPASFLNTENTPAW